MKYTTKRSKVEEVVIDFEDGCVLKVTRDNMVSLSLHTVYIEDYCITGTSNSLDHYEVKLDFYKGISYSFNTRDKTLVEDLIQLSATWINV